MRRKPRTQRHPARQPSTPGRARARPPRARADPQRAGTRDRDDPPLIQLQRTVGNRAVQQLVRSTASSRSPVIQRALSPAAAAVWQKAKNTLREHWSSAYDKLDVAEYNLEEMRKTLLAVESALDADEREPAPSAG